MSKNDGASRTEWEQAVARTLERAPERRERFETASGLEIERLSDLEGQLVENGDLRKRLPKIFLVLHVLRTFSRKAIQPQWSC